MFFINLQLLYQKFCFKSNRTFEKEIIMKKLLLTTLLIFALLISACASGENDLGLGLGEHVGSGDEAYESPVPADSGSASEAPALNDAGITAGPELSPADVPPPAVTVTGREESTTDAAEMRAASSDDEHPSGGGGAVHADAVIGVPPPAPAVDMLWDSDVAAAADSPMVGSHEFSVAPQSQGSDVQTQAGLMTAGEWDDNNNWDFWSNLMGQDGQFREFRNRWQLSAVRRYVVRVVDENNNPVRGAEVSITGFTAITNHEGVAYVIRALNPGLDFNSPTQFTVTANGETQFAHAAEQNIFVFEGARSPAQLALDLMFVIDTTGSMGDELRYIQNELDYVISNVSRNNTNLPLRLSVNFYRDIGDEYVVRPFTFSTDITTQIRNLNAQSAAGGGDRPEAVDAALQNAIHEHEWNADSVKLMFIVLDAPPHHNQTTIAAMSRLAAEAAAKGIRIIPLLASDGCTETEFLMRSLAIATGGTYTFVTGHSGISTGRHVEPTIGDYDVEKLNELLIKIISRYLS
jgi:hypothetical protein